MFYTVCVSLTLAPIGNLFIYNVFAPSEDSEDKNLEWDEFLLDLPGFTVGLLDFFWLSAIM
jgi:hypothetical protein